MSKAFIQANTNGRLHSADEPSIAPVNRGFLYGDAIYEVWRTYHGAVFAWEEHYNRLERSAAALFLTLPWTRAEIAAEVARTAAAFRAKTGDGGDLYIRLQVSRGGGPIGLDVALADRAEFVILVQPCPVTSAEVARQGLRLALATQLRRNPIASLDPAWKTGNYLNNILCLREARAKGADDVVILNLEGEVTEAATSNLAFFRGQELITPRLGAGILGGITRSLVLGKLAVQTGLRVTEACVRPSEFGAMTECFLMSTTKDITPVRAIDDWPFQVGPETATARLKLCFAECARAAAQAANALRV